MESDGRFTWSLKYHIISISLHFAIFTSLVQGRLKASCYLSFSSILLPEKSGSRPSRSNTWYQLSLSLSKYHIIFLHFPLCRIISCFSLCLQSAYYLMGSLHLDPGQSGARPVHRATWSLVVAFHRSLKDENSWLYIFLGVGRSYW